MIYSVRIKWICCLISSDRATLITVLQVSTKISSELIGYYKFDIESVIFIISRLLMRKVTLRSWSGNFKLWKIERTVSFSLSLIVNESRRPREFRTNWEKLKYMCSTIIIFEGKNFIQTKKKHQRYSRYLYCCFI